MMASPTPSVDSLAGIDSGCSLEQGYTSSSYPSDSSVTVSPTTSVTSTSSIRNGQLNIRCGLCHEIFVNPKVLPCFHTFCQHCLENVQDQTDKLVCPRCQQECSLTSKGISGLLTDVAVKNFIETADDSRVNCTSCKNKTSNSVARCYDCSHYLCPSCVMAHQHMHCFEGHTVLTLSPESDLHKFQNGLTSPTEKIVLCSVHKMEALKYFCLSCDVPICKECTISNHLGCLHEYEHLSEVGPKQIEILNETVQNSKSKANDFRNMLKNLDHSSGHLQIQYHKAQNEINETYQFYKSMLEERKQELLKELESVYSTKQMSLNVFSQKVTETMDKLHNTFDFYEKLRKYASTVECLVYKKAIDSALEDLMSVNVGFDVKTIYDVEFVSNYQAIQVAVRNTFGYVRSGSDVYLGPSKQPPIARPANGTTNRANGSSPTNSINGSIITNSHSETKFGNGLVKSHSQFDSRIVSNRYSLTSSFGPFTMTAVSDITTNGVNSYSVSSMFHNGGTTESYSLMPTNNGDSLLDVSTMLLPLLPPKSEVKRQKMIYHCKFGEFGVLEGQFTEPSGVAVNAQNDIIVADTNNHRIQIFDKEGRFKFQFGECGKKDGQLLYPNRVAVVKTSGDIIVTERSPTHQIQIYNQYGQFVRKFGANILQHPRGVTVDNKGRIIIVECKVMRVLIFDQNGTVLQKFGCSKHLEFPNGVAVNDKQEIFISDNRAHSVKVFNYDGVFLRQIGHEGITNYPIGVGLNSAGEILIADNHNNFNLTVFTQDGQLVSALESKVKHAQCFDVALMDDGSAILASKDYRLYIYRYVPTPPLGL